MATAMARSATAGRGPSLGNVVKKARTRPNRAVIYAVEGFGKTSLSTFLPSPIVLMTKGEDGLRKLMENGLVPETPHFDDEATTWNELLLAVQELVVHKHSYKTLVIDTVNGAANLCIQHVIERHFENNATKFADYGRGWKVVPSEWSRFIEHLTRVNENGMSIMLLAHADIKKFQNPEGMDYDRYTPRMAPQVWEPIQEWADMVLFGQLETFVKGEKGKLDATKGKALGGQDRLLYCERTAVADAKNRHNLPGVIACGQGAENAWNALKTALLEGRMKPEPTVEVAKVEEAGKAVETAQGAA